MFRKLVVGVAMLCILTGCGPSQSKYDELRRENEALKAELDEIKYGAKRLFVQATEMLEKERFDEADETLAELLERHPESDEAQRAKVLAVQIADAREEKAADVRRAEKEREIEIRLIEEQRQREIDAATARMYKKVDEMEGITWYDAKSMVFKHDENNVKLYFGIREGGEPWLCFRVNCYGRSFRFIDSYFVVADGKRFDTVYEDFDTEVEYGGSVREWARVIARSNLMPMIRAIVSADKATIRFKGDKYNIDHIISQREKDAMRDVLMAFEAMGGVVN